MSPESYSLPKLGLIGLGNAGRAMLQALSAEHHLSIYDCDLARYDGLSAIFAIRPSIAETAAELAARADLIILSLPNPAASI